MLFLGYSPSHKGSKCLAADGRSYISKDVTFNESAFAYPSLFPEPALLTSEVLDTASSLTVLPSAVSVHLTNASPSAATENSASSSDQQPPSPHISHAQPLSVSNTALPAQPNSPSIPTQTTFQPTNRPDNAHPMCTRAKSGITNPRISPTLLLAHLEPKTTKAALTDPSWL